MDTYIVCYSQRGRFCSRQVLNCFEVAFFHPRSVMGTLFYLYPINGCDCAVF